ncbi:unnamed protein product [Cunninghamella blakesleeana]
MINAKYASTAQTFQSLPITLRRRTASHNPKRVPKSVRDCAIREMQKSPPGKKKSKRIMRKSKPKSTVQEYIRRQLNHKWLETHIWHTKRMKIKNKWGYRLATKSNIKSERAIYRSFSHITTVHDASYFGCIEWLGNKETIANLLKQWTDPFIPSIHSQRYMDGNRIGHQLLYNQYPNQFLCPITFLWRQTNNNNNNNSDMELDQGQLWIWIHPCAFNDVYTMFKEKVASSQGTDVQVIDRRNELLRFDFTGPRSTALLQTILEPVDNISTNAQLWNDLNNLRSSSTLPPGCVLSLTIKDPRLKFPQKVPPRNSKSNPTADAKIEQLCLNWPKKVAISNLWDTDIRNSLYDNKIADYELLQRKNEKSLDSSTTIGKEDVNIPILLFQRGSLEGKFSAHYGINKNGHHRNNNSNSKELKEGWTLIIPRGWGVSFLKSFTFAGARVTGILEQRSMYMESGLSYFPYDYPGIFTWEELRKEYKDLVEKIWDRKPPGKRVNYHHIGTIHPFEAAFETIIPSSTLAPSLSSLSSSYWIIQEKKLLEFALNLQKHEQQFSHLNGILSNHLLESALIKIKIILLHGGKPVQNARIYIKSHHNEHQHHKENEKMDELIGFLTTAGFSLSEGCGVGIGAITLNGLKRLLLLNDNTRKNDNLDIDRQLPIYIKNPQSLKHRPGLLTILM